MVVPIAIGMVDTSRLNRDDPQPRLVLKIFQNCPGGGIGRHAGLKILWPAMAVTVQLRSGAQLKATQVAF